MQFDTFCQSKKSIKFSFRLITFYYLIQRLLKVQTIWFDPYCPFKRKKKKKKKKLHSNCVFYFSKLLSRNYSQVFYASFHKKLYSFFFSIYNILEKFESGTVWVDPYYPLKIKRSIFVKSSYGSNYIAFLDIYI